MTRMQQYMQLVKYAELCWASYSEGLNEGMFGEDSKSNENREVNDSLIQSQSGFYNLFNYCFKQRKYCISSPIQY